MNLHLVRLPLWRPRPARWALYAAVVVESKLLALRAYWLIEQLTSNLRVVAHLRLDVIPHKRIALQEVQPILLLVVRHRRRVSVVPDFSEHLEVLLAAFVTVVPAFLVALAA